MEPALYSYVWDNGVTNGTAFTPTSTATYTVTGTDANGCVATDDVVVTVNSLPTITGGASVCVDETVQLSSIDVAASSNPWVSSDVGVATVSSSGLVTGVGAGTATITFTNNNGCQATHSVTVNAVPTISGTLSTIIGGTTTLTGSGTAASTGAWVSSAQGVATVVSGVVTGVSAGTTTITYTTSSGCSVTETVTIYAMPTITSSGVSGPQEVCAGSTVDFDGSGTAASSSPWTSSNGAVATVNTNGLVTGVSAGTATITYTDNNGGTASQTVTVHALPTVSAGSDQTVCAGTSVTLSGSGASTYSWDNGVTNGVSFIPTTTTTYTVTGTDGNGCVNTDQVVVTVNPIPTISNMADVCVGTTLTLAGSGTASSTTPWASSDASVATITSSGVVTGVAAGTTTITYLDNNGCSKTETLTVLANPTVAVSADDSEVCSGTTVTLTATGGTTYTWADNSAGATRDVTPTSTTTYTVTGEDANGCSSDASVTVTVNALPAITGTFDVCVGETTDLDANGIPATSSPWTSSNTSVATVNSNGVVTGIAAGIVEITYTNTNGCSITENVSVNALPSVSAGVDKVVCSGSTVTLSGTGAVSYVWDNGVTNGTAFTPTSTATYTVTGTDGNGCVATDDVVVTVNPLPTVSGSTSVCVDETVTLTGSGTAATSNAWVSSDVGVATVSSIGVVTGVSAGSVNITYTNNNGCQKVVAMTVNAVPTISGSLSTIIGGTTTLSGSGTPATTGAWTSSSQSVATVSSSGVVTGLTAGTTNITYTTSSGCSVTEEVTIYAMPTITSGGVSGPQEVCVGSTIDFDGSGTAASSSPWTSSNTSVASIDSDGLVTGVSAGTATITYTDNNGGTATQTVTVNPLPTISGTTSVCIGSSVTLTGNGTAATSNAWTSSNTSVATVSSTGEVTGVAAGTATITYTNNNGCSITETVTVNALPTITGTFAVCVDATVTLSGSGTASTTTPWASGDNSIATVSSSGVVTGVAAGSVNITYTDNNGCQTTQAITVNALPTVSAGADQTICSGSSVTLSGSGAVSYSWDNSVVNGTAFVPTATATYTVTGTNANGCIATDEVVVTVRPALVITGTLDVCVGSTTDLDGNSTPATSNAWTSSSTSVATVDPSSGVVTGLSAGTTTITYTDDLGCTKSVDVTVNALPSVNAGVDFSVCAGSTATLAATGAVSYVWDNGVTNGTAFTPTSTATYTVTGTDGNGCVATDDVVVTVNPLPTVSGSTSVCVDETVTLTGSGTAATSNAWVSSDVGVATVSSIGVVTGVSAGSVNITYTNNNGCQKVVAMTVNAVPTISGSLSTIIGGTTTLSGSGTPATTGAWTSSSQSVATVSSSGVVTGLTAGTTNITYTTSSGCSVTEEVTIYAMPTITSGGVSGPQEVCVGSTIDFDGSGTAASSSPWTSSNTSVASIDSDGLVTGVSAGTATITYTDNNGGTATQTVTVNPLPTISGTTSVCIGSSVTLTGNGTAATSNAWTSSNTSVATVSSTGEVTGVAAGTATITYTNNNGCSITETVTVNALPTITGTFAVCVDATVTLSGSGTASTTTPWASGDNSIATVSSSGVVTGVAAGSVNITYTDNNGCQTTQAITVNALPTVSAGADQTICSGSSVTLSGSGAVSYSWDNSVVNGTAFVPTATATYTVTGTNANGCIATDEVVVTVRPALVITGTLDVCVGSTTDLDGNSTPATSNAWTSSSTSVATVDPSSGVVTGLSAGTTTITYTDDLGCTKSVDVTVNALPSVNAGVDFSVCAGSTATLAATGAVSYVWDNGVTNGTAFTPTSTATYTVTGTDGNGCVATDDVVVTVNPLPTVSGSTSVCVDETVTLTGSGTAATSNAWVSSDVGVATVSSIGVVTGVSAGSVNITYTNNNGCQKVVAMTVNAVPTISGSLSTIIGGTTTLSGSGTPATTGAWTSSSQSVATVSSSGVVTGLTAGTTNITYTTSSGCSVTEEVTIYAMPTITSGGVSGPQEVCVGSTIDFDGSGTAASSSPWTSSNTSVASIDSDGLVTGVSAGTATITYTDNNGGTATQTVTVNPLPTISGTTSVCIGSSVTLTGNGTAATSNAWTSSNTSVATVSSTGEVTGVAAGTATITYTNNNGCSITETVTVNALPTITGTFAVCVDATVTLSGSGTASTTTPWASGDNSIATVSSSGVVTGVAAGSVNITYTDNNGCQTTQAITVNALPTVSAGADQTICSGSSVTLSGSGAVSYSWDNSVVNGTAFVPTATATYTVTGTNANGCIATDQVVVTVNDAPIITGDTELCIGESIDLDATGTPASSNAWVVSNPGVISIQNASLGTFLGAAAGTSTITYTDVTGCSNSVTVTVNALPVVSAGSDFAVCDGESTVLSATGATSYAWDNGVTNGTSFIPTATATYTVTGTDANGCVATDEITVTVNDLPVITGATSLSVGNSTTLSTTSTSSLTNPWSVNNSTLATISSSGVLTASSVGTVVVTYEDDNGCTNTYSVNLVAQPTITATPNPALSPPAVAVCIGESITLIGSNTPDPSTPWTITSATSSILTVDNYGVVTGMSQGTGVVVYTDSYGGQATQEVEVLGTPSITGTMNACPGESVTLLGVGDYGITGYSWASSNGTVATFTNTSSGTISALATGTTTVTYTNGAGCSTSQTFTVNALPIDPVIAFDDGSSSPYATCPDGGIKIVVSNSSSSIATSYKWYRNGSEIVYGSSTWNSLVTSSTANSITVNAGGVYKAKGISGNSCESGASNQLTITDSSPNAAPVLSLSNVVNGKICPQTTATITASSLNGYSYLWYESSFQNSSNKTLITPNGATNDSHTTSSEKTYYVRFVDNMGCMGTEATINVDYLEGLSQPLPVINDYAVCNADELVLTVSNKEYYVTYTWSAVNSTTGGAVSSGLSPASETYRRHSNQQNETNDAVINPQSYDINGHLNSLSLTYKVESSLNGCTLDSTIGQPVVINGTPSDVPVITSVQGSSPIELCPNTSTTLSLSTTPVTGLTYEWEVKPNTGSWTIGNTTAEANELYRVRSKYPSTGCYSPYSESFIINEKSIPQPVLAFNGLAGNVNTDYLCGTQSGDYVELTVDNYINDYDPGTIFKLVDQSGTTVSSITGVGTTTNPYFTISTPSVYTVIAESGQCVSSPSATKEVKEVPIVKPNIVETSNNTVVCENNETITLGINNSNYFSTNNGIEYRYSWYQIGSISNTLLSENATYSSASAYDYDNTQWGTSTSLSENYYVVLQAKEQGSSRYLGCSTSDTITITINKAPDAPTIVRSATQTVENISICDGDGERVVGS